MTCWNPLCPERESDMDMDYTREVLSRFGPSGLMNGIAWTMIAGLLLLRVLAST